MSQMFRTTLRLDLDKPASANAVALLRQLHAERGLSYSALIVPAVNAYYGKPTVDEGLRETIRSIVREELAAPSVQFGDLLQTLNIVTSSTAPSPIRSDEPDDDDLDDAGLEKEIKRCDATVKIADAIIHNGELALKTMQHLDAYGLEPGKDVSLAPMLTAKDK